MMELFNVTYNTWKTVYTNYSSSWSIYQLNKTDNEKTVWTGNTDFIYKCDISSENYPDYSGSLESSATIVSSSDDAKALIVGLSTVPNLRNSLGLPTFSLDAKQEEIEAIKVTEVGRVGIEEIRSSHNFCDPTTWHQKSNRVLSQSFVPIDETNTIFSSSNPIHVNMIDLEHGKVHKEHLYENNCNIHVRIDGESKTRRIWSWQTTGDYKVLNYSSGTIEFFEAVTGSVEVDFNYAGESTWILDLIPGYKYDIEDAEGQFSLDCVLNDTIVFEIYGYADIFAPQLVTTNGGYLPPGTKIPIKTDYFRSLVQVIDEAKGSYPVIPSLGGERGTSSPIYGFPFRYGTVRTMYHSYGMELRVSLENDRPCDGNRVTVTFFAVATEE